MTGDDHSAVVDFCFKTYEVPISSAYNVTVIDDSKELLSQQEFHLYSINVDGIRDFEVGVG